MRLLVHNETNKNCNGHASQAMGLSLASHNTLRQYVSPRSSSGYDKIARSALRTQPRMLQIAVILLTFAPPSQLTLDLERKKMASLSGPAASTCRRVPRFAVSSYKLQATRVSARRGYCRLEK